MLPVTAAVEPDLRLPGERYFADPEEFLHPLDVMVADHSRMRLRCDLLERLADDLAHPNAPRDATFIMTFLRHDYPAHLNDERHDLIPMLKRRCRPSDALDERLGQAYPNGAFNLDVALELASDLEAIAMRRRLNDPARFRRQARAFADRRRRLIAIENSRVIPLARKRLSELDLVALGRNMAERRGIRLPI